MKKTLVLAFMVLVLMSCNSTKKETNKIFPKGDISTENFTGVTWVKILTVDGNNFDVMSYNVTFEPGSRTDWHSHPGGQILYCTSGEGYYQEKGKPARPLKKGDVVEIKPDIVHWHGAAPNSEFVHMGISTQLGKGPAVWYGSVTDEEYSKIKN